MDAHSFEKAGPSGSSFTVMLCGCQVNAAVSTTGTSWRNAPSPTVRRKQLQ